MSEESGLPAGTVSLEPDEPTIVGPPVAPTAAPAAEPAPQAPQDAPQAAPAGDDTEPEGLTEDATGRKFVPLRVLQATRDELKAAKALAAEADALRAKAQAGEQTQQWIDSVRPLLAKLKDRPDMVQAIMAGQPVPGVTAPAAAPDPDEALLPRQDAEDLARTLELYTPEGQPDVVRARKVAAVMRRTSDDEATRKFAPLAQSMAVGQSGTLRAQYGQVKDKAGRTVNPQVLEQLWSVVPAELIARDPNVAGVLYYAAKGYAAHHGLDEPTPPPKAPIVSEAPGGSRNTAPALTEFDRHIQKAMQTTEKQYSETGARYKPGAINLLE